MVNNREEPKSTEDKILEAATKVFTKKGLAGARMQDIADEASINKAMLHYYYRSKQQLFELVFEKKMKELFSAFRDILDSGQAFEKKIRSLVATEIDMITRFPALPLFVLNEIGKNPKILEDKFHAIGPKFLKEAFRELISKEIEAGTIRPVPYDQFLINLMSLCMYPILAKPVIRFVFDIDDDGFKHMMETRKKLVADLILNDILLHKNPRHA